MKIDPYYQRQKCRPMNLVSENIRFMRIFAGVPFGEGVKRHWGLSMTAIFGDLGGHVFENFRDTASDNMWRYATPCRPVNDCKMNDLEWLFHDTIRFRPARLESEPLNVRNSTTSAILRCSMHCTIS